MKIILDCYHALVMQKSKINVNVFVSRRKEWGNLAVLIFLLWCLMLDFHRIGLQGFYSASYKCHCFKKNPSFSTHNNVCMTVCQPVQPVGEWKLFRAAFFVWFDLIIVGIKIVASRHKEMF